MKALLLLEPGDMGFLPEPVPNGLAVKEFDFEKHFYHGLTQKIWDEYALKYEVVEKLINNYE